MTDKQNTKTQRHDYPDTYNQSDSLYACSCGGLYCSTKPLPMDFTLPLTRLAFKHLRPLSCLRLGHLATLTTWVSTLYVRLIDSLECQDAFLSWILTKLYNEALPRTPMELRLDHEAPPWAPTNKGHRIMSWPWGTTTKPSWNYILTNEAPLWDLT